MITRKMILSRQGKNTKDNMIRFSIDNSTTKPDVKQILSKPLFLIIEEKLYDIDAEKVNTYRRHSRFRLNFKNVATIKKPDRKYAFVYLKEPTDIYYRGYK